MFKMLLALAALMALSARQPGTLPVRNYGDRTALKPTPVERAAMHVLVETAEGHGGGKLAIDEALVAAARVLADDIQDDPTRSRELMLSTRTYKILQTYGVYDSYLFIRTFSYATVGDIQSAIALHFKDKVPPMTHAGIGVSSPENNRGFGVAVVILSHRRVELEKFPRKVRYPSSAALRGRLSNSAASLTPAVMIITPGGKVKTLDCRVREDRFAVMVPFEDGPGTYRVEVLARGKGRAELSALLKVRAGDVDQEDAQFEVVGFDIEPATEIDAEQEMMDMINQVRMSEGLSMLMPDPKLTELARAHSQDMMENSFVGHLSPTRGDLGSRSREFGMQDLLLFENVALNPSLVQAMNNLLQSPAHREAIMNPKVTHMGVGIAIDPSDGTRHYYVTQEFARLTRD